MRYMALDFDRIIRYRAHWLKANKPHFGNGANPFELAAKHLKVVVGRNVWLREFVLPDPFKPDGTPTEFNFVAGIPVEKDPENPDRYDIVEAPIMPEDIEIPLDDNEWVLRNFGFNEETAEEAVARLVEQDPQKHGVTLEQRKAHAVTAARRLAPVEDEQAIYERRVRELGGDPDAMMAGNKPRYTMESDEAVKDHETGEIYYPATVQPPSMTSLEMIEKIAYLIRNIIKCDVPGSLPTEYPEQELVSLHLASSEMMSMAEHVYSQNPRERRWNDKGLNDFGLRELPSFEKLERLLRYVKDHETGEVHQATVFGEVGRSDISAGAQEAPEVLRSGDPRIQEVHAGQAVDESGNSLLAAHAQALGNESNNAADESVGSDGAPHATPADARGADEQPTEGESRVLVDDVELSGNQGKNIGAPRVVFTVSQEALRDPYCEHVWPGPEVTGQTPCSQCGLTWGTFRASGLTKHEAVHALERHVAKTLEMVRAACLHAWPDDPQPETTCPQCGVTFEEWANS